MNLVRPRVLHVSALIALFLLQKLLVDPCMQLVKERLSSSDKDGHAAGIRG